MSIKSGFAFLLISIFAFISCGDKSTDEGPIDPIYRQYMRQFVQDLSSYGRQADPDFIIIPQNGQELLAVGDGETGAPAMDYIDAIDGVGREDLIYGYDFDNIPTPVADRDYMMAFLDTALAYGVSVLVTDYCWTQSYVDDSYAVNTDRGYISFAADQRELNNIPSYPAQPYNVNSADIDTLSKAANFLYILNPSNFGDKTAFIQAVSFTDFDVLIIDAYFNENMPFTPSDISALKIKNNGGTRLVISYMSIGEAEDYRYYWQSDWAANPPSWLAGENPDWPGNYKVRYWDPAWQSIIFGNDSSYLKKILDAGFDGVYLDIIDAFEYFE